MRSALTADSGESNVTEQNTWTVGGAGSQQQRESECLGNKVIT